MSKLKFEPLTKAGQICEGDMLIFAFDSEPKRFIAKEILCPGSECEEVIVNRKKNQYFITSMAIDGTSWAKDVHIVRAA